ncbi:hypothetical protein GGR57DRAFT_513349 [Xylariaceae sp. FL1272]|nr:hypothetical protein GGR57DRAFT_513349 [Xylariaceae sp. FL1272]
MGEPAFPLFGELPPEIRLAVWAYYSLPKTPMVHAMSFDKTSDSFYIKHRKVILNSFPVDESLIRPDLEMVRVLMRTNREARYAVLRGRQLQATQKRKTPDTCTDVYYGGAWHKDLAQYPKFRYFFVNWDIDLFYFRCGLHIAMPLILHDCCVQKMQRIAVDIKGPDPDGSDGSLYVQRWPDFSGIKYNSSSPVQMEENRNYHIDNLKSLNHLTLVLPYQVFDLAYIDYSARPILSESSNADEMDPDEAQSEGSEDGTQDISNDGASNSDESTNDFDDDEDKPYSTKDPCSFNGFFFPTYNDRQSDRYIKLTYEGEAHLRDTDYLWHKIDQSKDGFGFHLVERTTKLVFRGMEVVYDWGMQPGGPITTTVDKWVRDTKSAAARNMYRICSRSVGVNMVMDHSGDWHPRHHNAVGYDRVWGDQDWRT